MPFDQVMHKFKSGTLKSGSGGNVNNRKQAIAIMLSEKRKAEAGHKEYQPAKHSNHPLLKAIGRPQSR